MALNTTITANKILNRVGAEVGIKPVADPYASQDPAYQQMTYLLNIAGEELAYAHNWEFLTKSHQFTTSDTDDGIYPLPDDFLYLINQTGWERSENIPLGGPLSAQDWTYLLGRDLAQNTLYASFRIFDGNFNLYPLPPPNNLDVNYEYISTRWVSDGASPTPTFKDEVTSASDVPLFDRSLITRYVKLKYLEASGFDTTKAQADFNQVFSFLTGYDKGAGVLNAGRGTREYPYITTNNLPDTGFGL